MARYLIDGEYVDGETYRNHLKEQADKAAAEADKAEATPKKAEATPKKASN